MEGQKSNYKMGVICIVSSAFCFALMNLFIRLAGDVPTVQKCFFRNFFALLIAVGTLIRTKTPFQIGKGNAKYLFARSFAGCLGMLCNFYAVDHLAISDASILNKLSPFFAIIFSVFLLKEKANKVEWISVFLAFIGAVFVVKPSFHLDGLPAGVGLLGGMGAGVAYTYVRKLGMRGENSMIIVCFFSAFTTIALCPYFILHFTSMTGWQWFCLCLTGISAAFGQIFITRAYTYAPAKEISVYDFSIVLFSAVFGGVFLGQLPDLYSVIGYVIIIGVAVWKWYYVNNISKEKE